MNNNLDYKEIKKVIESFYKKYYIHIKFKNDIEYLETSFNEINSIWLNNLNKIDKVNYLMIAEAPLWGKDKKYFYNSTTSPSQFFYKSDLEEVLNIQLENKKALIDKFNDIGLVLIDISPFALNSNDTQINYGKTTKFSKKLSKKQYKELIKNILPFYFEPKLNLIQNKKSKDMKVFFRYKRVRNLFEDIVAESLINRDIINYQNEVVDISQQGGGVDRHKLKKILESQ